MCLTINSKKHKRSCVPAMCGEYQAEIAKRAITVYKLLKVTPNGFKSPYSGMRYEVGKMYSAQMEQALSRYVLNGLHAYRTADKANSVGEGFVWCRVRVFEAHIPRGARYFIGIDGDIVSNKLRVLKPRTEKKLTPRGETVR